MVNIKLILSLGFILLIIPIVYANYAVSSPTPISVEKGSTKTFDFQIQAYHSDSDLKCNYDIEDTSPFEVLFNEDSFDVKKGSAKLVKGTVKAPKRLKEKTYSYNFCIGCTPNSKQSGATTNIRYCGIPLRINIISNKKEIKFSRKIFMGISITFIVSILVFLLLRKNKKISLKNKRYINIKENNRK